MKRGDARRAVRVERDVMLGITDSGSERNVYVHPNALAREIFWQRLDAIFDLLRRVGRMDDRVLDFGGGSGAFARGLSSLFREFDILDIDAADARRIKEHFRLANAHIIEADVREFTPPDPYDIIIAADVLEHFEEVSVPVSCVQRLLRPGGLLVTSCPTENALYEAGRLILRKEKPADHFSTAAEIFDCLEKRGFVLQESCLAPRLIMRLPLFRIGVFRKEPEGSQDEELHAPGSSRGR